ncbi:MAG: Fic family protein [Victivallales bacterium]|nr:Fic family protein [Victivallales bacterium]
MRTFNYEKLAELHWDNEVLRHVAKIHEYKGRLATFADCNPKEALRLVGIAKIQSTEYSNRLEGIVTTSTRLRQLVQQKTMPRSRSEREIVGYRDVLNTIHESHEYIPIRPSYILQLQHDLMKPAGLSYGGHFRNVQNYISETREDGTVVTRFTPVAPYETKSAIEAICASYGRTLAMETVDPLILIPVFVCDFLCIHPFNDGNGRMSRLLTLLMLYQNGYDVGKYISIEAQIAKTQDEYYEALQSVSEAWHGERNDVMPFIRYMLQVILSCYVEFGSRANVIGDAAHSAYDVVLAYVKSKVGRFRGNDAIEACTSAGRSAVLSSLKKLTEEGIIRKEGAGRATFYIRNDDSGY